MALCQVGCVLVDEHYSFEDSFVLVSRFSRVTLHDRSLGEEDTFVCEALFLII